jgi:hypothetical protein
VERGLLGRLIFDRIWRRDVVGALLWQLGQRYGRIDPVSLRDLRSNRHQAYLGPRERCAGADETFGLESLDLRFAESLGLRVKQTTPGPATV